uniref:C2H2-type domain-containing protein n=1 Tax=Kwoniella dejecticola CBS 10117 TaxID=1296121 RepID=A0A1A6A447_9TREE|nr:uncharacterized protein I303_04151 [Kwoniella dejecticola CBS 10117]OBR84830.1 hypothetical protein I303_04151 [Kwoniella dejecticola CBS 10117]
MDSGPSCFRCTHQGCSKTFTRKDHLFRHAANHSEETYNCPKCGRPFKRLDLLQRHEKRNICGNEPYRSPINKRRRTSEGAGSSEERTRSRKKSEDITENANSDPPVSAVSTSFNNVNQPSSTSLSNLPPSNGGYMNNTNTSTATSNGASGDFISVSDLGFGLWAPEQWEALLHESLAPPFNEPIISNMNFDFSQTGQQAQQLPPPTPNFTNQWYQPTNLSSRLLTKLQLAFPDFNVTLPYAIESLEQYWMKTAPTFPFIHQATLDYHTSPAELIILMIIVGAVHTTYPRRKESSRIVMQIRGMLFHECGLEMPTSTLQSFTLCHVYDTWYGNAESLFVAQCMWPVMVAHSRKKGIGVAGKPDLDAQGEEAWASWAKDEERRRSAYCVLLMDTQLSAFWNQHCSRQLSIFAHNLNLPCPKSQWEARTASEWLKIRRYSPVQNTATTKPKTSKSGYLPGLHPEFTVTVVAEGYSSAIMSALSEEHKFLFKVDLDNSLTIQMVLIGLIAIAWDCRTRGGMGIRFREGTKHWRSIVFSAVIQLRAAYESAVMHMSGTIESRDMRDTFAICIISVLSDIPMLHVAAGATSFCGASIGPRQYSDAKRRLKLWAKTDDAWTCVWQSVRYLRQALFSEWGLYSPWAVFNTTRHGLITVNSAQLVLWGYTTTIIHPPSSSSSTNSNLTIASESTVPPPQAHQPLSAAYATTSFNFSAQEDTDAEKQRKITSWFQRILNTEGKMFELTEPSSMEEVIKDLLEIVCMKLDASKEDTDKDNSVLLARLMSSRRGTHRG